MLLLLSLFLGCATEARVEAAIEEASYCTDADDCVDVGSYCPFGCYIVVNEAEADHILDLIERYERQHFGSMCMYDCAMAGDITCEEGRCGRDTWDTGW